MVFSFDSWFHFTTEFVNSNLIRVKSSAESKKLPVFSKTQKRSNSGRGEFTRKWVSVTQTVFVKVPRSFARSITESDTNMHKRIHGSLYKFLSRLFPPFFAHHILSGPSSTTTLHLQKWLAYFLWTSVISNLLGISFPSACLQKHRLNFLRFNPDAHRISQIVWSAKPGQFSLTTPNFDSLKSDGAFSTNLTHPEVGKSDIGAFSSFRGWAIPWNKRESDSRNCHLNKHAQASKKTITVLSATNSALRFLLRCRGVVILYSFLQRFVRHR